MNMMTKVYLDQLVRSPERGQHILAHCDASSVVVYQAYEISSRALVKYATR